MKNYKRIFKRLTYVVCGHAFFDAIFVQWKGSVQYVPLRPIEILRCAFNGFITLFADTLFLMQFFVYWKGSTVYIVPTNRNY